MRLTVETNNFNKFNALKSFLRSNGYKIELDKNTPLSEEDWCIPGRPATEEELETLAKTMEEDQDEGIEASTFFNNLIKEINEWK